MYTYTCIKFEYLYKSEIKYSVGIFKGTCKKKKNLKTY